MKFRKIPVVVEAEQWFPGRVVLGVHGCNWTQAAEVHYSQQGTFFEVPPGCGWIDTLEGAHIVSPGDWIVTGVKGERWPVKPDIFEMTYEPVEG